MISDPLTKEERRALIEIFNGLTLLTREYDLPRPVREHLYAMTVVVRNIALSHGMKKARTHNDKRGTLVEWPESPEECWNAIK